MSDLPDCERPEGIHCEDRRFRQDDELCPACGTVERLAVASDELARREEDLTRVTAERDRMREALHRQVAFYEMGPLRVERGESLAAYRRAYDDARAALASSASDTHAVRNQGGINEGKD